MRGRGVLIPAISLWEIARLAQEGRLKLGERQERWFAAALATVSGNLAAITPDIAVIAAGLSCEGRSGGASLEPRSCYA
jgi:PIN domain nuclease of toxin-antitoxin system